MGKRSDLGTSWTHVVQTWFLGQPTTIPEDQGWSALGILERLAPEQIDELKQLPTALPLMMSRAIRLGIDLGLCEPCKGFEPVLARVRKGMRSAISEIMWGALVISSGYSIELEPFVGAHRADTLIATGDNCVYAEVMTPGMSKETTEKLAAMQRLADRLRLASHRVRLEVYLSEDPRTIDGDELLSRMANSMSRARTGSLELTVGAARWEPFQSRPSWSRPILPSSNLARFGVVSFSFRGPESLLVNVSTDISDARIQRMVQAKRRQMHQDEANLLVVDMSGVTSSKGQWDALIQRRFQPDRNTRISAVVMLHEKFEQHELQLVASLIRNPYARQRIPASLLEALTTARSR